MAKLSHAWVILLLYLGFMNEVQYGSSDALFQQGINKNFLNIYMAVFISQIVFTIVFMIVMGCN